MRKFERVAVVRGPSGNNLNRFHTVTAIEVPNVWFGNDALQHIRRAYPMVVRVDLIRVDTPQALKQELDQRVRADDRYGETRNNPKHIFERFVLEWPTSTRPARIKRKFSTSSDRDPDVHEGLDITATPGGAVRAGFAGRVKQIVTANDRLNYGAYVQISTTLDGVEHVVTFTNLRDIQVSQGQTVTADTAIANAAGDTIKLVVQRAEGGLQGFKLPNVVNPTDMIYWADLRLRPTVAELNVRDAPGMHGDVVGIVRSSDLIEPFEGFGRTLAKVQRQDQWLRVRFGRARQAYSAAWLLEARGQDDSPAAFEGVNVPGMNLDVDNPVGTPDPNQLKNLGWVRFLYNVSLNPTRPEGDPNRYGNTDLDFTFRRFLPVLQRYVDVGLKIILVFTHQTFGEGQGYVWPQMDSNRWRDLTAKYANIVGRIAEQFRGRDVVFAYQIWNEQDTKPEHARAAVPIPPADYAHLLAETIKAIRQRDSTTKIITGGHVTGPGDGPIYLRQVFNALPGGIRPDGVAFHPYGRGPLGHPFTSFGAITESVRIWSDFLPGKPVWITEWGILNAQGNDSIAAQASTYATGFLNDLNSFPGGVAAACWYAWGDGMDNGYGLVRSNGTPRQPLYDAYLR